MTLNDEIAKILLSLNIANYYIHKDGTVDVIGHVNFRDKKFTKFPVKFGKIGGNFDCESCCNLTSLDGAPHTIDGYFDIYRCHKITSLLGFNSQIRGTLWCQWENIKSGGIGIILNNSNPNFLCTLDITEPFEIIQQYVGRPEDIFECQMELIDAGYEEYAQL